MRVLFINISLEGHHLEYIKCLAASPSIETTVLLNKECLEVSGKHIVWDDLQFGSKNPFTYLKWIKRLKQISKNECPDIIHFVYGDSFYRTFGIGFKWIRNYNSVVTFHNVRRSVLHDISIKKYFSLFSTGIVHTTSLLRDINNMAISNCIQIEYPVFSDYNNTSRENAKSYFNLPSSVPILVAIGGTRPDKGLDILLKALKIVKEPFHLLIAGKEEGISSKDISRLVYSYSSKVTTHLAFLSNEEFGMAISASDIVILPYRTIFDGASGPLVEGVLYQKMIIGPNHGSIGEIITTNRLGLVFESENVQALADTIEQALCMKFAYDKVALAYRESITSHKFMEEHQAIYRRLMNSEI